MPVIALINQKGGCAKSTTCVHLAAWLTKKGHQVAVVDADGNAVIRDKVSRQDLAKMVGASREMVSRVMKDLEERRFIETQSDGSMIVKERLNTLE